MTDYVICMRDPDASNEFLTFGSTLDIIDVDYGRMDLRDPAEFKEWRESLTSEVARLRLLGSVNAMNAAAVLEQLVREAEGNFGHQS